MLSNKTEDSEKSISNVIFNDNRAEKRAAEEKAEALKEKILKEMLEKQALRETGIKNNSLTSFIEPHEEKEAIDFVESQLGFKAPRVCGYYMALKVFVRSNKFKPLVNEDGSPVLLSNGEQAVIELPDMVTAHDKHKSYVGLVVAQGSECYTGERFKHGPWCKVGDWVVFGRHDGPHFLYKDIPFAMIPDDKVYMVIENPEDVVRG